LPHSSRQDLLDAYNLLLSPIHTPSIDVLQQLQLASLKSAYRKKALETHPDRSKAVGELESRMNDRFIQVCLAYDKLKSAINNSAIHALKDPFDSQIKKTHSTTNFKKNKTSSDHFYTGIFPRRKLLIGQYLYYSKEISWKTLVNAIIWQKKQRPPIGQLALKWGLLSSHDIKKILVERTRARRYKVRFGEFALQKGYISTFEHMALLGKQRRLHRPIGEYFTKQKILYPHELEYTLKKLRIHNKDK